MKIIGLTGLTGAGKSTVAQKLMAYGCYHIDADKVAREVINNNENVKNKLKERFGEDVINADDRFIQQYLRELNDIEIAYLVANKSLEFRAKIFDNMSKVRSEVILEEEEYRKPMLKKDCDEITQKFISHLRRAYESGQLMINGRDEEKYV